MVSLVKHGLSLSFLLLLAGCSWFGGDEDESTEPKKLESIKSEIRVERRWDRKIGDGAEDKAVRLVPGIAGSRIFAASADGNVVALNVDTGKPIWKARVQDFFTEEEQAANFPKDIDAITGGVGIGGDLVVVAIVGGELVALNQSDGSLAWRAKVTSEVLAPPQVDRDVVVAHSIDGKVAAWDALDGTRRWRYSTSVPSLTLRGTATPILLSDLVIAGFANGRVVVLNRTQGLPVIDERIAIPQGKSDLERLVDIDGTMVVNLNASQLFVASYQGNFAAIDLKERRIRWMKEASSVTGLGRGFGNIYISFADSRVGAFDMENSSEVWENDALLYRDVTAPVAISSYIVVGDYEGYIHFIAQSDGRFVGRQRVDGDGIKSSPVIEGSRVYILGNSGRLYSYEIR